MVHRDVLDDGEAQTGATGVPRACLIGTVEAFEDPILVLCGYSYALVHHGDLHHLAYQPRIDGYLSILRAVGDRVLGQVGHRGDQVPLVAVDGQTPGAGEVDIDL